MSEASLRQPCKRMDCVFHVTPLDSEGPRPLKLSRAEPFPPERDLERSSPD
jgi:hypothetical protein